MRWGRHSGALTEMDRNRHMGMFLHIHRNRGWRHGRRHGWLKGSRGSRLKWKRGRRHVRRGHNRLRLRIGGYNEGAIRLLIGTCRHLHLRVGRVPMRILLR